MISKIKYYITKIRFWLNTHDEIKLTAEGSFRPFLNINILNILILILVYTILFTTLYHFFWKASYPFPDRALVSVERGESLKQISQVFEEQGVVRSAFWLKTFIIILGGEKRVVAGDYYFPEPLNVFSIARILHRGEFGLIPLKITIQEGFSSREIASLLGQNLPSFEPEDFIKEVNEKNLEGYLFPDTYFFMPNTKASGAILIMRENFSRQIDDYEEDILKSEKTLNDIMIMASIIEKESNGNIKSKRIVSGILWKRLKLKMLLQVDAPFRYYNGKHSYTLTKEDLKEDHPYNTYVNKGLPPTPISNPGIDSIRAAIAPTNTEYLFFMSDKAGNMYYAKNFDGHQANREKYLR